MTNDTNENFRVWTTNILSDLNYVQGIGPKLLEALENYTNFLYQAQGFKKLDSVLIELPVKSAAMENWGLIIFYQHSLFPEKNSNSIMRIDRVTKTLAHEITHQWFGNLVTPDWWDYIWLKEGFARYFEYAITDQVHPSWRMMERFVTEIVQSRAFLIDANLDSHPMEQKRKSPDDVKNSFNSITYAKSGSIIRMISYIVGEEKFKTKLRNYLKTK
ncbi:hypothetical protein PV327_001736 [Microctonus hyperodae]|uniref:glutamyl aminopeptidase n=1 Tax=Microctonus hyperodae TaxID=165561 RepID=A0AA39FEF4_MICHY|nr:hypothetical protein PV327_001736 [Microctonus hyperodae]